jgi:large subunit ribosomal protein L33
VARRATGFYTGKHASQASLWLISDTQGDMMAREYVWLECTETGDRNYRVQKETRGTERLELKKYCPKLRKHTVHKESRKK